MMATNLPVAGIVTAALAAAQAAAETENNRLGPEKDRGLDCGFAWVTIKPARGPLVAELKRLGLGETRDYGGGGFQVWYSKLHSVPTQSISVHIAAARAFAETATANGYPASYGSRYD
jgi:hypothetical protein